MEQQQQHYIRPTLAPFRRRPTGRNGFLVALVCLLAAGVSGPLLRSVEGGVIVRREAIETTTVGAAAEQISTTAAAPTTRTVDFEGSPHHPPTREIEFGYDSEAENSQPATVAELRQDTQAETQTTMGPTAPPAAAVETSTLLPATANEIPRLSSVESAEVKIDGPAKVQTSTELPVASSTTTNPSTVASAAAHKLEATTAMAEPEPTTELPEAEVAEATTVATSGAIDTDQKINADTGSLARVDLGSDESGNDVRPVHEDVEELDDTENQRNNDLPRFDLSRYTSPSNFSQGGTSLEQLRAEREEFFAERTATTTELPSFWETTTTLESLGSVSTETEPTVTETNEVIVPDELAERNHTIESNRTIRVDKSEIETSDYELASNEVRNQTAKGKKGKFLDQFGATEDNDINGAAWALAGMRIVDRASSKTGQSAGESVETVRDDSENVVANNTLKQLMDWAIIMQDADFANSSFIRPTSAEVDLKSELKDRRKYANKTPGSNDAVSVENRVASVVTELSPEASAEVTTTVPPRANIVEVSSTSEPVDDDLEDFKFVSVSTTRRPDLNNFIQETTPFSAKTEQVVTTLRPTRGYEVSENVDENEGFIIPDRSTTPKPEVSTNFDDMPVTTYSPVSPLIKRVEVTTEPTIPPTVVPIRTTLRTIPFRGRRPTTTTTTTQEPTTISSTRPVEETTPQTTLLMTTTTTTTSTTTVAPTTTAVPTSTTESNDPLVNELAQKVDQLEDSSPEVDSNALNQTNNEIAMTTSTTEPTNTFVINASDSIIPQQSTILPTVVEFRPAAETTTRNDVPSQPTETPDEPTNPNQPVLIDEKNVYNTVSESSNDESASDADPSIAPGPEPTAEPTTTTRRSIDRQMTTTELSEEESVTEDDYVEISSPAPENRSSIAETNFTSGDGETGDLSNQTAAPSPDEESGSGVVVAVVASLVSVIIVLLLIAAFLIFRKRQAQVSYGQRCRPVGLDAYSLDNVSVYNSVRRKGNTMRMSKRSYGNSAFEDPGLKTNPLTVAELANIIQNKTAIYDEFKEIPNVTARADEVPEGCEDKNRYANVVPLPETRVHLKRINDDEKTEYINANFVKGPKDSGNYYIACQAPMENTINDFWRMIWEQNSKVIIMATDLSENGVEKCAEYLPPSVVLDNNRTFGDFQLTLKNRENKEKYTISTVHLRNTQTNTWREIMHFWYQWPDTGVPIDESSIIAILLEARSYSRLAPCEMADASNGGAGGGGGAGAGTGGITSITEEGAGFENGSISSLQDSSVLGSNNVDSSNNNNNNVGAKAGNDSAPPSSIMTNGTTNTMDKHKSLQRTQGPITVHCSPGTGRTGTIIACDVALRAVEIPPRTVDIPHIVYYVRRGRASAVRTREQYELIYRVANVYATKLTGPTIET